LRKENNKKYLKLFFSFMKYHTKAYINKQQEYRRSFQKKYFLKKEGFLKYGVEIYN
jgi:hypothetical protein